jgi:plasmid maintenance system antidote protein VapI
MPAWSRTPQARAGHPDQLTKVWIRWLALRCALPLEHVAIILEVDLTAADDVVHRRHAKGRAWAIPTSAPSSGAGRKRQILGPGATKIYRLHELGYSPSAIAEILGVRPSAVRDLLRRWVPIRRAALVRVRSRPEQSRIRPPRRRPAPPPAQQEIPADEAWRYLDGPSPHDPPPPAPIVIVEPDQVVVEVPAPAPQPWTGSASPMKVTGEANGRSKLNWPLVREVRRLHSLGWTCYRLAQSIGVDPGTITAVVTNRTWKEV